MHFKKGAIAAALLLAGCSGEQGEQSLACPEGMERIERHGLEQCVSISGTSSNEMLDALRATKVTSSVKSGETDDHEPVEKSPLEEDSKAVEVSSSQATESTEKESNKPKANAEKLLSSPDVSKKERNVANQSDKLQDQISKETLERILRDYEKALEDDGSGKIKRLSSHDLNQILSAHIKKVNFNDVDTALKALDDEPPLPWEVDDEVSVGEEVNERSVDVIVEKGDSLFGILASEGIESTFYYQLSKNDQSRLSNFNVGDKLSIKEEDGTLYYFSREISPLKTLILERVGDEYEISEEITDPDIRLTRYHFELDTSLYINGNRAGLSDNTIANLQRILGERINFSRDIQKGDSFTLVLSEPVFNGQLVGKPTIAGAKIGRKNGRDIHALRYENKDGVVRYYDKDGSSLQTGFIRQPVNATRLSSHFNPRRKHPVTGRVRPHLGADFAAPTGTPIYAASDGKVTRAGWASGYGNVVYIDHGNGVQTRYAHMSKFNTRRGKKVNRGDVIGYVGMTGTATGPHLHYEYRKNGKALNPLSVDLPTADPISKNEMGDFKKQIMDVLKKMDA